MKLITLTNSYRLYKKGYRVAWVTEHGDPYGLATKVSNVLAGIYGPKATKSKDAAWGIEFSPNPDRKGYRRLWIGVKDPNIVSLVLLKLEHG